MRSAKNLDAQSSRGDKRDRMTRARKHYAPKSNTHAVQSRTNLRTVTTDDHAARKVQRVWKDYIRQRRQQRMSAALRVVSRFVPTLRPWLQS
ncbi:hypothetical protein DIPPA_58344, partial [Diplonema papillatum]